MVQASTNTEGMTAANGERAPAGMLVAVRASGPVAAMPPNSGHKTLAMPSATSSEFGSCLVPDMPSETTAASSDSMAPSMAMANAGPMSACNMVNENDSGAPPGP